MQLEGRRVGAHVRSVESVAVEHGGRGRLGRGQERETVRAVAAIGISRDDEGLGEAAVLLAVKAVGGGRRQRRVEIFTARPRAALRRALVVNASGRLDAGRTREVWTHR